MSTAAQQLLAAFDALPTDEREAVVVELLARHPVGTGDMPEEAYVEMAEELFLSYDAAESSDAAPSS